jgi:hypothetical protein
MYHNLLSRHFMACWHVLRATESVGKASRLKAVRVVATKVVE